MKWPCTVYRFDGFLIVTKNYCWRNCGGANSYSAQSVRKNSGPTPSVPVIFMIKIVLIIYILHTVYKKKSKKRTRMTPSTPLEIQETAARTPPPTPPDAMQWKSTDEGFMNAAAYTRVRIRK